MRLHRLEIEAFGPFAARQTVDFDALAEHGLFLLNGATGSGKTSVLDAVCFALYGGLPGARHGSKSLKSHHAEASAQPETVLEFSAQGRRFEVRRTPEWQRPSARSRNGFVTQQASTHLRELVGGEWQALSSRSDEASGVVRDVLGMDREQFTRVVMLPQGEFAAFLRAKPSDREDLLESLFATGRFGEVEARLAAMAQDAEARAAAAEQAARVPVRQLEAELSASGLSLAGPEPARPERAGLELAESGPSEFDLGEFDPADPIQVDDGARLDVEAVERRFAGVSRRLALVARSAGAAIDAARLEVSGARAAEEACRRADEDAAELSVARNRRSRWEAHEPENAVCRAKLQRAAAAAALRYELEEERLSSVAAEDAASTLATARAAAAAAGWAPEGDAEPTPAVLRSEAGNARAEAAVLAERIPLEEELESLVAKREGTEAEAERRRSACVRLDAELAEADEALARLAQERARLVPLAASRPAAERDEKSAREVVNAVQEHAMASGRLAKAESALLERKNETLARRGRWLDLREERLAHTAFELAAQLDAGSPCPVCGSEDHPRPARGDEDPLRLVDLEKDAASAAELALERERMAAGTVADAKAALSGVVARGGDADPDKAARELEDAVREVRSALDAEARLGVVVAQIESREARRTKAASEREASAGALLLATAECGRLAAEVAQRTRDLAAWRDGWATLRARHAAVSAVVRVLEPLAEAAAHRAAARTRLGAARASLAAALVGSPFETAENARAALLADAEIGELRAAVEAHAAEERTIVGLLASAAAVRALEAEAAADSEATEAPEAAADSEATEAPEADMARDAAEGSAVGGGHAMAEPAQARRAQQLAARVADLVEAEALLASAQTTHHAAEAAHTRCERLAAEFRDTIPALLQQRGAADLLTELQRTARGSGENRLRMSLHRYVLAARLEQVAAAASERLAVMSDGRFSLEHTDALAARGAASGLGLEVMDAWTGQRRDPATLSGGESFMASLALALGLADVVQHESGGVDIETLFVDEGFGTLDEQALEQVMEAIEGLRDGGRTVGLVSHVPELKQRIPAQIRVAKGRSGSSLAVVAGGGSI
ncbi:AAA family ATPase [Sinomonas sp. ASV322]|uniref:AAA family ATPase n=1 Tax=Sinomonas sp. ASV322 TaxID=3041920 RepID=UPI0027DD46AE|nr:AAA family ATPase [Sinomonas sp. ASV322]MDQ4502097.1 AAA family ATPase [Sinomonas sp. ASV322]